MTCTAALTIGYIVCQTQWGQVIQVANPAEYAQPVLEGRPAPIKSVADASNLHKSLWADLTDAKLETAFADWGPRRHIPIDWSKVKGGKP